jgi:aminoglycoside phosphotransferase (APT) family kinase protein
MVELLIELRRNESSLVVGALSEERASPAGTADDVAVMIRYLSDDRIEELLLRYLQTKLRQPDLRYLTPPARFAGGFENRVYSFQVLSTAKRFSGPLVLRLFSRAGDAARGHRESALQNALADLGFPAPRVFVSEDDLSILGGPFTVMERLPGTAVYDFGLPRIYPAPVRGNDVIEDYDRKYNSIGFSNALPMWIALCFRAPRQRAEIQARLHSLDAGLIVTKMREAGIAPATIASRLEEIRNRIEVGALNGLRSGIDWLLENQPCNDGRLVICHGDLWSGNILSERSRITGVLDWSRATLAPAEFDVAHTNVSMRYLAPAMPAALRAFLRPIQYDGSLRYLREYCRRRELDRVRLQYFTAMRCLNICSRAYRRRIRINGSAPAALKVGDPAGNTDRFEACFRHITRIPLMMPPERTHSS